MDFHFAPATARLRMPGRQPGRTHQDRRRQFREPVGIAYQNMAAGKVDHVQPEVFRLRNLEGQLVAKVLEETNWNISKAASILGINRTTLYNKIRLHNLGKRPSRRKVVV